MVRFPGLSIAIYLPVPLGCLSFVKIFEEVIHLTSEQTLLGYQLLKC